MNVTKKTNKGFTPAPIVLLLSGARRARVATKRLVRVYPPSRREVTLNTFSVRGFTLIEVLLVIALIAILAGITIVAINPAKQYANAKNAERMAHVDTILNAVHQYMVDNEGMVPGTVPQAEDCWGSTEYTICVTDQPCNGVDLPMLTLDEKYLTSIPENPGYANETDTGYNIVVSGNGRVTVCALGTDLEVPISATR